MSIRTFSIEFSKKLYLSDLLVKINGLQVFAVSDASHATGSIALYTQDAVTFDDVAVLEQPADSSCTVSGGAVRQSSPGFSSSNGPVSASVSAGLVAGCG